MCSLEVYHFNVLCVRVCVRVYIYAHILDYSQLTVIGKASNNSKCLLQHKGRVKVGGDDRSKQLHHSLRFLQVLLLLRTVGAGERRAGEGGGDNERSD